MILCRISAYAYESSSPPAVHVSSPPYKFFTLLTPHVVVCHADITPRTRSPCRGKSKRFGDAALLTGPAHFATTAPLLALIPTCTPIVLPRTPTPWRQRARRRCTSTSRLICCLPWYRYFAVDRRRCDLNPRRPPSPTVSNGPGNPGNPEISWNFT